VPRLVYAEGAPATSIVTERGTAASIQEMNGNLVTGYASFLLWSASNPRFGGQRCIESTLPKIGRLKRLLQEKQLKCDLEVDGGIDIHTAPLVVEAGADVLVAGTSVFSDREGPGAGLRRLMEAIQSTPKTVSARRAL